MKRRATRPVRSRGSLGAALLLMACATLTGSPVHDPEPAATRSVPTDAAAPGEATPAALTGPPPAHDVQACGGQCINPHPGPFRSWYGARSPQNTCAVQFWRQWQEGCTHYQWFNTCNNTWDQDPYGNAIVYWSCCVH
jgi:hypothetical protein